MFDDYVMKHIFIEQHYINRKVPMTFNTKAIKILADTGEDCALIARYLASSLMKSYLSWWCHYFFFAFTILNLCICDVLSYLKFLNGTLFPSQHYQMFFRCVLSKVILQQYDVFFLLTIQGHDDFGNTSGTAQSINFYSEYFLTTNNLHRRSSVISRESSKSITAL